MKSQEEKYLDWGIKFFEIGYNSAIEDIKKVAGFAKRKKTDAVIKYIKEAMKDIGMCNCMTKTPDPKYHAKGCPISGNKP